MTDTAQAEAVVRKTRSAASLIWLIPLLALIVGSWLLVQNIRSSGPEITLLIDSAEGIEVNNTVVRVLNVDVGRITKIRLRADLKGVELTAKLNADAGKMMRSDTKFWIVKPRIDQNGISGLGTLVSGSYIAFMPGKAEEEERVFKVADIPPIEAVGRSGIRLQLSGSNSKMLEPGSPVMYEGFNVGTVETAAFDPDKRRVGYTVFINSPNDRLITGDTRFRLQTGVSVSTAGGSLKIDGPPLPALFSGAIAFSTPAGSTAAVPSDKVFELYNNLGEQDNLPGSRALYYVAFFKQSVRGLSVGSTVDYKGLKVGSVSDMPYFAPGDNQKLFASGLIPVRLRIDPDLIDSGSSAQSREYWQQQLKTALEQGLTAVLASDNLVLGSKMIELTDSTAVSGRLKPVGEYRGDTVIAAGGSGLDGIQEKLSALLDKFNSLPLDKTLKELNNTLASADRLLKQPALRAVPAELNQSLQQLRTTLQGISPQSPVYREVRQTLDSIDRTLSDVRPLLQTVKEKPNALIFNSSTADPLPKGNRP